MSGRHVTAWNDSSRPRMESRIRRLVSVYDCVAGRVNTNGFIHETPATAIGRVHSSHPSAPVAADDFLSTQRNAPSRYEEDDVFAADRKLASHQRLPDSDLLKALHLHSSQLYAQVYGTSANRAYLSLDETALLALGILVEEAAADLVNDAGDLDVAPAGGDDVIVSESDENDHVARHTQKSEKGKTNMTATKRR